LSGRFYSYLNTAQTLIGDYKGEMPFHHFLRTYFRSYAKYGSRDRRSISALCYAYWRTGRAWVALDTKDKILASHFLCLETPDELLSFLRPEWCEHLTDPLEKKIAFLASQGMPIDIGQIFPFTDSISPLLQDREGFIISHLVQPRLFLRIRPGREERVEEALKRSQIPYNILDHSVELPNGTDAERIVDIDRDAVVQDLSSQATGKFIASALESIGSGARVWDCCAASGGKSIMAYDLDNSIKLTVSDIRPSILQNLERRFSTAGVRGYESYARDLSRETAEGKFDLVIADVPCSGSGTWGRTPEDLSFFTAGDLSRYTELQRSIAVRTAGSVRKGGRFIYFTCSVYREENDEMVEYILQHTPLELISMELVQGWQNRADSMFMAHFTA
jgi:16S rRNA (cytosine967-C5)-methyltransferase